MLLSLKWLREFVPFEGTPQELGDKLTMLGLELEEIIHPFAAIKDMVVGHVLECVKHPEAEKLSVCTVDVGEAEPLTIVCGAPNVAKGQKVPVAKVGTTMPDGMQIKKAKLRGQPSHGMICSERELGLSEDHDGIMVLPGDFVPGANLVESLDLDEVVLDISITPNRADGLSVLGLAREVALAFDLPLTMPSFELKESGEDCSRDVAIEIADPDQCPVFHGRILEGFKVGKSPAWLRYRLVAIGLRPISNMVDITNYVMMELGQPMHAYDLDLLEGNRIVVDFANEGETFVTLDGQERSMKESDLMIKDDVRSVGIAGVMGGLNTEMNDESTRVFLEAAVFRPGSVRKTARRLGLSSDASYRFERGVDQVNCLFAMNRAASMMAELSGAALRPGICKSEPRPWKAPVLRFRPERARDLLGVDIADAFCRKTLEKLGCSVDVSDAADWKIIPPSHRQDYEREADLIEEVARVYGMDNIAPVLPKVSRPLEARDDARNEYLFWAKIKRWASGLGLNEVINYSFVGQKDLDHLGLPKEPRIPIMNPLTAEQDVLRTELAPGLLQNLRHNLAQGNTGLRLFELAHIFEADSTSDTTARESGRLNMLVYGDRYDAEWPQVQAEADYQDIKGYAEHLLAHLHLGRPAFELEKDHSWMSPCVSVTVAGTRVGVIGRVKPEIADAYHAKKDVWMADLDTDLLCDLHARNAIEFQSLPVYPPSRRDITVMAPATLNVQAVIDHVEGMKLPLLKNIVLIDVFVPKAEEGKDAERNLTYRLTFRHASKTLTDKEVDKERAKVAESLQKALAVRI
ncbi:phenylalanine--tRNA ligase subunit beta [Desulfovibrio subterraneus]|uniref:Phenylalanine--tRNA ligase beta subunit n=1 Tax=Desulfovibrio subterraneus TaxID=2718620 RepID=A0A7J0BDU3_9BACT|nr:phenylalanine--tRNA ligase subunit beta [Desulfovibrio subterraneus]GFM31870.1 phenylalanine--tRNA ligase beta subunit [Desulfovibrio subterraneus]